jgi:segregation and condensation protein A
VERRRSLRGDARKNLEMTRHTTEQVLGIAHEEDIEGRMKELQKELRSTLKDKNYTTFTEIAEGDRSHKLMTYVSLLFLANIKEIWLEQEELFGELFISYPAEVCS